MKTLLTVLLTSVLFGMSASAWADDGGAVLGDKQDSAIEKVTYAIPVAKPGTGGKRTSPAPKAPQTANPKPALPLPINR